MKNSHPVIQPVETLPTFLCGATFWHSYQRLPCLHITWWFESSWNIRNVCQIGSNWIIFPKDHPWTFQKHVQNMIFESTTIHSACADKSSLNMDSLNHPYCFFELRISSKNNSLYASTVHTQTPTTSSLRQVEDNITKGIFLHCFSTRLSRSKHSWGCDWLLVLSQIEA